MLQLAHFDLDGLGTEVWAVAVQDYAAVMAAWESTPEDDADPDYHDHDSPLDRAASAAGKCPVLAAHWGTQDVPATDDDAGIAAFLKRLLPADRAEAESLLRR